MAVQDLPSRAQVVIVGGGVVGTSTAYHLARRGWTDVVRHRAEHPDLRHDLARCWPGHAGAGTDGTRQIVQRSLEVFHDLERDTGLSTGFVETGTLALATSADRWSELQHQASAVRASGVEAHLLDVDETLQKYPLLNPDGVVGSLFFPRDGRGSATDTTMSLARGATQRGAHIAQRTQALSVLTRQGRVVGVETDRGTIECEYVVNAAGMWGRQFAAEHGVEVPLQALAHFYVVTDVIEGLTRNLPTLKSGDDSSYVKDEAGALMVGFFEPGSYPYASRGIPTSKGFIQLAEDWDHLGPFYEKMVARIPVLEDASIRLHFCGPESFTPDGHYHLGPAPRLAGYYVAAGFNSVGFLSGPGVGSVLADWIVDDRPPLDVAETDPARVQDHETNRRFLEQRVVESLDLSYDVHWPFQQRQSARGLRRSPLHAETEAAGAVFGELVGWERANWYAPTGVAREYRYSFGRPNWFEHSAAEHTAVRERVGVFDTSSFGKLLVQGRDALALMQRLCANDIDVPEGRIVYTQWLNDHGGIEADVTVTRMAETKFLVLSGPATVRRDLSRIEMALRRRAARHRHRRHGNDGHARRDGPPGSGADAAADRRRPVGRSVPLRTLAPHRPWIRLRPRHAGHLRRRARLGAADPQRHREPRPRGRHRRRTRTRTPPRRLPRSELVAIGEGLPQLGTRHRLHRHPA